MMTISKAAAVWGVTRQTVYNWIAEDRIAYTALEGRGFVITSKHAPPKRGVGHPRGPREINMANKDRGKDGKRKRKPKPKER